MLNSLFSKNNNNIVSAYVSVHQADTPKRIPTKKRVLQFLEICKKNYICKMTYMKLHMLNHICEIIYVKIR
jgi:hypothetical protein